jgi:hypothetical protein
LRERLYAAIGFVKCDEVAFPFALKARMITNPDAPSSDHFIRLRVDSQGSLAIPILFSSTEKYDVVRGGEFFNYLQFQLLLVERTDGSPAVRPMYDGRNPKTVGIGEVSGFFEQVGNNTQYIIHPEEILADNFALLVLRNGSLPSPEILKKLEQILQETRKARPAPDSQRGVQSAHFPQKTSQCNAPPPAVSTLSSTSAAISTGPAPPSRRLAL